MNFKNLFEEEMDNEGNIVPAAKPEKRWRVEGSETLRLPVYKNPTKKDFENLIKTLKEKNLYKFIKFPVRFIADAAKDEIYVFPEHIFHARVVESLGLEEQYRASWAKHPTEEAKQYFDTGTFETFKGDKAVIKIPEFIFRNLKKQKSKNILSHVIGDLS